MVESSSRSSTQSFFVVRDTVAAVSDNFFFVACDHGLDIGGELLWRSRDKRHRGVVRRFCTVGELLLLCKGDFRGRLERDHVRVVYLFVDCMFVRSCCVVLLFVVCLCFARGCCTVWVFVWVGLM